MGGVSFIMCCHNSEGIFQKPLISVINQITQQPYELVLVDNNCSDKTSEIAKIISEQYNFVDRINIARETIPGLSYARRAGVNAAKYDYLVFVDDDNIISEDWVDIVVDRFENHADIGIIGSNNQAYFESEEIKPVWFDMVKGFYACAPQSNTSGDVTLDRKFVFGAGMCARKKVLIDVYNGDVDLFLTGRKGNLLLSGDDSEICMRAIIQGWRLWYCENLHLQHIMHKDRMNWTYFKKMQQGHFASHVILNIYMSIIDNTKVPGRLDIAVNLFKSWAGLILKHKLKDVFSDGAWSSVLLSQNIGKTKGYIHYFIRYGCIKKSIQLLLGGARLS